MKNTFMHVKGINDKNNERTTEMLYEMIRKRVKRFFKLYDIKDLQAGGNCGLCGKWISDQVLPKKWSWSMCDDCQ